MNENSTEKTQLEKSQLSAGLYLVSTPIGNLRDITFRAVDVLQSVDFILCEDTRHFQKLATTYGILTPKRSLHEHNEDRDSKRYVEEMKQGRRIALVSDAGTPLVNDPGYPLVRECRKNNVEVFSVPGPCAAIAALSVSGIEPDRFMFSGYLPVKKGKKTKELTELLALDMTAIIYESSHRILDTLELLSEIAPDREFALCRELTKVFEQTYFGTAAEIKSALQEKQTKGEFVLVLRRAQ